MWRMRDRFASHLTVVPSAAVSTAAEELVVKNLGRALSLMGPSSPRVAVGS